MNKAHLSIWLTRFAAILIAALCTVSAQVQGPNGHYYRVMIEPGLLWDEAKSRAAESTFNGVHGHLATITSPEEDQFIEGLRLEAAPGGYNSLWIGGSQLASATSPYDNWFWVNGEGSIPTGAGDPRYSNWHPGEPNDYSGPRSENHLSIGHFNQFGWNDEPNQRHIYGYVVEYPSAGRASLVKVAATDAVAVESSGRTQDPTPAVLDTATFTFSRSGSLSLDLPVYYSIHGSAVNGADYNEITRSIIIPAGQSEVQLQIVPRSDALAVVEPMETVGIRIEPSMILTPTAAYDIDPQAREAAAVIYENTSPMPATVNIAVPRNGFSYPLGTPITVIAAVDHSSQPVKNVEFLANDSIFGTVLGTENKLGLDFYRSTWTNPPTGTYNLRARVTLGTGQMIISPVSQVTVLGDQLPTVSIRAVQSDSTQPWPDADFAPDYFEVTRTGGSTAENLQVFYSVGGTATADVDYDKLPGYVVIPAGRTSAKIVVTAKDDTIDEPNETVVVTLVSVPEGPVATTQPPTRYNIDPAAKTAEVVILDNDEPASSVTVSIVATVPRTVEPGPNALIAPGIFKISRTGSTSQPLNVQLGYGGSATRGVDYRSLSNIVTIPAGSSSIEVSVEPIDDQIVEGDETVIASLPDSRPTDYAVDPARARATVVINDNDSPSGPTVVRIDPVDPIAIEAQPDGGPAADNAIMRVSRTGDLTANLLVFYSIHGTAKNREDYEQLGGTITIPAGKASVDLVIIPRSDTPSIGHKYEIVHESGLTWVAARDKAAQKMYLNIIGHLATITSAEEDATIEALRQEAGAPVLWVGGYQDPDEMSVTEGWKWVNDEGPIPGANTGGVYANWSSGEPNDYWGPASENAMVIGWLNAGWNDQGANVGAAGYVIEYDVEESAPGTREIMETVGIRIEQSAAASPLPSYSIDPAHRTAAAVIFDGQPASDGSIEVAIPSSGAVYQADDVEFLVVAQHPISKIQSVDFYVDDVKVGSASAGFETTATTGGVTLHWFKWPTPANGQHVLQAKATLGGRVLQSSPVPFTVQGVPNNEPPTVSIKAADPEATEFGPTADGFNPARFLIERTGATASDLPVFFSVHGTAKNGEDYQRIASPITIPAGKTSVALEIVPLSDRTAAGHRYDFINENGVTWEQARAKAEAAIFEGVKGHLATITSAEEDQLIESLRQEAGGSVYWVGGYQEPGEASITEGWKWVNNEGPIPGRNDSTTGYANWLPSEPNDYWGLSSENHMVIGWLSSFGWNDQAPYGASGYVVEFDVNLPAPGADEIMETVGIRLEPSPDLAPVPAYNIDASHYSAAAVIFDHFPPTNGAIEIAIPSSGEVYSNNRVDFLAAAYHPTEDIQVVEFFVDDANVGVSRVDLSRPTAGGVIQHRLNWDAPTSGLHFVQAKATLSNGQVLVSSRIPFTVEGGGPQNIPPVAKITFPADGSVYIDGDSLKIAGAASDTDGSIVTIEILLDGVVIVSRNGSSIEHTISPDVGSHTIAVRATDDKGATGTSQVIRILVRDRHEVAFVQRELPATYSPGVAFNVALRADPPEGTFAYAVEDRVPTGWLVSGVSHDGAFDRANSKVKFGPFTDGEARSLTYSVTPPTTARGAYEFFGHGSVNGALYPITGDTMIEQLVQQYHPADSNTDFRITLSEVTAYAAAWKSGRSWPTGPVPIPLAYVTRAHHIWQRGETYRFDPSGGSAPACWIPVSSSTAPTFRIASVTTAQRYVLGDMRADAATQIQIATAPATGTTGYAVEERPPHGWTISNISDNGVFDPATGTIRWGVFSDGAARTLSYTATPPPAVTSVGVFAGQLSYNGKLIVVSADARLENSVTVSGASPIRINSAELTATGAKLIITGPAGQTGVIEASTDFSDWTEVKSIFIPTGALEFTDNSPAAQSRFYRVRVQ